MKRGEIRWYKFARPDKRRPVLILTRTAVIPFLHEVTIAPLTRTIRDITSEVLLSRAEGMAADCAINCDHLQTIDKSRIGALIATLPATRMHDVQEAISFALGIRAGTECQ